MSNRPVVVVTGATNGIGKLAALDIARGGADLAIVARNPEKAEHVRQEVEATAPDAHVDLFLGDLSCLSDARRIGLELNTRYERIGVLVNNAGVHAFSQRITAEGLSEMIAVNYLAPWVLTDTLRSKLMASAPSRIVTVASGAAQRSAGINPARDLTLTADYKRRESSQLYGRTKLMDIMFTLELGRQLAGTGVIVSCCDPGFNTTGLGRDLPFAGPLERILTRLKVGDPRRGAAIIVRLATDAAHTSNGYFSVKDAKPLDCPTPGSDETVQRDLWTSTATLVADVLSTTS
jgi:NAD(P)-dependent dehydrogenase (short-subunit alcohol dehydrogenase family)